MAAINYFINCTSKLNPLLCMASQGAIGRDLTSGCQLLTKLPDVWDACCVGCLRVECRKIEAFLFFWAISWLCNFSGLFIICLKLTTYSLDLRLLTQIENPFSWRVYKSIYIFSLDCHVWALKKNDALFLLSSFPLLSFVIPPKPHFSFLLLCWSGKRSASFLHLCGLRVQHLQSHPCP